MSILLLVYRKNNFKVQRLLPYTCRLTVQTLRYFPKKTYSHYKKVTEIFTINTCTFHIRLLILIPITINFGHTTILFYSYKNPSDR